MPKFRKKPVVVEAVCWEPERPPEDYPQWFWDEFGAHPDINTETNELVINTLEGQMRACPGDWIIKGVAGEFYPCKPDIFEQTYEPVEEGA